MLSLSILSFLRACFNTFDKAASMSATLDPWCTFKQASLNGGRIKNGLKDVTSYILLFLKYELFLIDLIAERT